MRAILVCMIALLFGSDARAGTVVELQGQTIDLPQNGVIDLSGSGTGFFFIDFLAPPSSGAGFSVLNETATVNGASFSYQTGLGQCPAGFCGGFPYVTDNVFGSHHGPGGYSSFAISADHPTLSVLSSWFLTANTGAISVPSNYEVRIAVFLPPGVAAVPEASTWAMMMLGLLAVGVVAHRRGSRRPGAQAA